MVAGYRVENANVPGSSDPNGVVASQAYQDLLANQVWIMHSCSGTRVLHLLAHHRDAVPDVGRDNTVIP